MKHFYFLKSDIIAGKEHCRHIQVPSATQLSGDFKVEVRIHLN